MAEPRRTSRRRELYPANEFYGTDLVLKAHAGWDRALRAVVPHGVPINPFHGQREVRDWALPDILAYSWVSEGWSRSTGKHVTFIGAPFVYLVDDIFGGPPPLPETKHIVHFPTHSTALWTATTPAAAAIARLRELEEDGWRCTVCLYYRDLELGRGIEYERAGFATTSCGHRTDPQFLRRLVELLASSTVVSTEGVGSHLFYAAHLGRTCIASAQPPEFKASGSIVGHYRDNPPVDSYRFRDELPADVRDIYLAVADAFSNEDPDTDGAAQRAIAREFLGASNQLPPADLRDVLRDAARRDWFHPDASGIRRMPVALRQAQRLHRTGADLRRRLTQVATTRWRSRGVDRAAR